MLLSNFGKVASVFARRHYERDVMPATLCAPDFLVMSERFAGKVLHV